jgi:hypothetical protein
MDVYPEGARLCPLIVDENSYHRYLNGSAYEVPELIDPATGSRTMVDGNETAGSGWSAKYVLPPEIQSYRVDGGINTRYYLILENRETDREVKVIYRHPLGAMYG